MSASAAEVKSARAGEPPAADMARVIADTLSKPLKPAKKALRKTPAVFVGANDEEHPITLVENARPKRIRRPQRKGPTKTQQAQAVGSLRGVSCYISALVDLGKNDTHIPNKFTLTRCIAALVDKVEEAYTDINVGDDFHSPLAEAHFEMGVHLMALTQFANCILDDNESIVEIDSDTELGESVKLCVWGLAGGVSRAYDAMMIALGEPLQVMGMVRYK